MAKATLEYLTEEQVEQVSEMSSTRYEKAVF